MTLSDNRYGAEVVTKKGKVLKFDDSHCILTYLSNNLQQKDIAKVFFTDFDGDHHLIDAGKAFFVKSEELQSPMGGNVAAFSTKQSAQKAAQQFHGTMVTWNDLVSK
jgi:copper chaperone NosL